ncbi:MAG: FtsQ-type POTRA domain-containing protein [Alphaproteobacteria bacterium]|nr:FtsQ-type POTRA domain-containing protein [Alphaproteobacteria bacterium]
MDGGGRIVPKVKKTKKKARTKRNARASFEPSFFERVGAIVSRYTLASVAGVVVILVGFVAILWAGGYFGVLAERAGRLANAAAISAGFEIRKVTLVGREKAAPDEVSNALGPLLGMSTLALDLEAARARIERLGWVKSASVTRLLPDTVNISIREREPAAVWQMSGRLKLIDDGGAVIRDVGAYEYASLPLIVGAGAPEAASSLLKSLGAHPLIRQQTAALIRVAERRWNLRLRNGLDVKLPEIGFDKALNTLSTLEKAQHILDQNLEYIDLRDPERLVLRRRGEQVSDGARQ